MNLPKEHYRLYDVMNPKGIVQVFENVYFWCEDGDPSKALLYIGKDKNWLAPQCNRCEETAKGFKPYESCELVFLERCFVPYKCNC